MLRRIVSLSAIAVLIAPVFALGADYTLDDKNTTIKFVGSKPQGKHDGGFKKVTGTASIDKNDITTLKISLEIDMDSLYSDNAKLTTHLKSPDFFGVKSNPKSKFVTTKVEKSGGDYKITGDLTMLGKTKAVTFTAKVSADSGLSLSSDFTIDRTNWGMNFGQGKVDNDVKLSVSIKAK